MTKNTKFWTMSRVLGSGEETPRSGEGPRSDERAPCRSEVKKEDFSILGFVAKKLSIEVLCRGEATIHNMEMLCFCSVLFFHCS